MHIWSKQFSIGNRTLDAEHQKIHSIINQIICSIIVRDVAALSERFELLKSCLSDYFVIEEKIARAINFEFTQHQFAHQHMLNEFQRKKDELVLRNGIWSDDEEESYARFLMNCLIQHIKKDGEPLKVILDTCFYDFSP